MQYQSLTLPTIQQLNLTSKSFLEGGTIPRKFTCDGININPSLELSFIPNQTQSLAILMEDSDAPINTWIHWLVWNIPVMHLIPENLKVGVNGLNDFLRAFYCGPCPMNGNHRYVFKVYALDVLLDLKPRSKKNEFERAISGHVLAYGELTAFFSRKQFDKKEFNKKEEKSLSPIQ
jgi:Raf kinase inhibitor-like YbhB/YbcL family protein